MTLQHSKRGAIFDDIGSMLDLVESTLHQNQSIYANSRILLDRTPDRGPKSNEVSEKSSCLTLKFCFAGISDRNLISYIP